MKHIYPESEATSAEEDDGSPNNLHLITGTVHSTKQKPKEEDPFIAITALVDNRPIKFKIYSGSPVTLTQMFNRTMPKRPIQAEY